MKVKLKVRKREPLGEEKVPIIGEFIKLDALLKLACVASTGGEAKIYVTEGDVTVNGEVCLQRGKKIRGGDLVQVHGRSLRVIGEGEDL